MGLLKNKKTYPFKSVRGDEETVPELREELENVYKYLRDQTDEALSESVTGSNVHDEVLCAGGEPVFAGGDIVMVIGIPNP